MRKLVAAGTLATATISSVLGMAPSAHAQEVPEEPDSWELSPGPDNEAPNETPADDPTTTTAGSSCKLWSRWDEKATAVFGPVHIDVFKGGWRPGACENDEVLTSTYANSPTCEKYAWGALYDSKKQYVATPSAHPYSSNAWGDYKCGMKLGGKINVGPIEKTVSVSNMIVMPFSYRMNGKDAAGTRGTRYFTNF